MESPQGTRVAERGSDVEFHEIPSNPSTNNICSETPGTTDKVELPILLRILQESGKPLPIGSFTERSIARKVYQLTGITLDRVTMVTPSDAVLELPTSCSVVPVAQELHAMKEWEDFPIYVSCLMGNRRYIMEVCQDRANYESKKKELEIGAERLCEDWLEQQETLTELVDKVNDQARIVGELQQQQHRQDLNRGSDSRIPLLQGNLVGSTGSVPMIPSSLHTPTGIFPYGGAPIKISKNPSLPAFSGEVPTPKGEAEYDNYIFQLKLLRSSYTDDAIRNAMVATMRGHAKIAIRAISYDSSLDAMLQQLENRFGLGESVDILQQEFHQMMQKQKEKVSEFGSKLEHKFRLLQEKCPGRYGPDALKERLFHGMIDKLRDSVRYLYSQPDCDFNKLLKAAMTCEFESASQASTRAKALQVNEAVVSDSSVTEKGDITSIRAQLEQMSSILKGTNYQPGGKTGRKQKANGKAAQQVDQDARKGLKGPRVSVVGPFTQGRRPVQCHRCCGWGHFKQNCPNKEPAQGSKEWEWANSQGEEVKEGVPLPPTTPANPQK